MLWDDPFIVKIHNKTFISLLGKFNLSKGILWMDSNFGIDKYQIFFAVCIILIYSIRCQYKALRVSMLQFAC
jgi:hypothetical protein